MYGKPVHSMLPLILARSLSRSGLAALACAAALFGGAQPGSAQDAADLLVRTTRLENQLRQMSGQIEQLQFENRRLSEQLRKFQEDVDFRMNEKGGRSGATAPGASPPAGAAPAPQRQRRGDAFDPTMQQGTAGAPQPLGGGIAGIIDEDDGGGPATGRPLDLQGVGRPVHQGTAAPAMPRGASVAAASGPQTAKDAYELAFASLQRKEYEQAEMGFRQFLQSYPRDRLAVDATYWLGESYLQRQRYREAAEQFLKISRESPKATKAPDSLLKLGMALNGLGAKDQACATYAKVGVDYPAASNAVRQGVARERRRSGCA
ncbi:Cell division coordinator CpoB [Hyphomicrobiales bacterium]|nr:Cell division coordinator CpoB [Hyphomicrobiales bacterium]CAH1699492.1 Cell division coordinator CpoB [Hyphomicrobiales bacterium]CAI0343279.1 Cell division coordinator CpoB [Hyphomicrobiales bacterium]